MSFSLKQLFESSSNTSAFCGPFVRFGFFVEVWCRSLSRFVLVHQGSQPALTRPCVWHQKAEIHPKPGGFGVSLGRRTCLGYGMSVCAIGTDDAWTLTVGSQPIIATVNEESSNHPIVHRGSYKIATFKHVDIPALRKGCRTWRIGVPLSHPLTGWD